MAFATETAWVGHARGGLALAPISSEGISRGAVAVAGLGTVLALWSVATIATLNTLGTSLHSTSTLFRGGAFAPSAVALIDPLEHLVHMAGRTERPQAAPAPAERTAWPRQAALSPEQRKPASRAAVQPSGKAARLHAASPVRSDPLATGEPLEARFGPGKAEIAANTRLRGSDYLRSRLVLAQAARSSRLALAGKAGSHAVEAVGPRLASAHAPVEERFGRLLAGTTPAAGGQNPAPATPGQEVAAVENASRLALAYVEASPLEDADALSPPLPSAPPVREASLPSSDDSVDDGSDEADAPDAVPDSAPLPSRRPQVDEGSSAAPAERPKQHPTATQALAYAKPESPRDQTGGGFFSSLGRLFQSKPSLPGRGSGVAIYDIKAATVYMPNGDRLEAHSGMGRFADEPRFVDEKNRGPTPPNTYKLVMRESRFHGVEAIRLIPVDGKNKYGRVGLLAHTYMLRGRPEESNGCVVFKNYNRFLTAFKSGKIKRLIVVPDLSKSSVRIASDERGGA